MRWWVAATGAGVVMLVAIALGRQSREHPASSDTVQIVVATPTSSASPPTPLPVAASPVSGSTATAAAVPGNAPPAWAAADTDQEPRTLYARLRREPRDEPWAKQSESTIKAQLATIPFVGGNQPLRTTCGTTVCEISGATAEGLSEYNANVAMQALQGPALRDALQREGLASGPQVYGGQGKAITFTLYVTRAPH